MKEAEGEYLNYDGTPDKRYKKNMKYKVIEASKPLPTKDGYIQNVFLPISIVNGVVSNKR